MRRAGSLRRWRKQKERYPDGYGDHGNAAAQKRGLIPDLDESAEINACSIEVPVEVNGRVEKWLVQFKNETHNHPTEIEPFGGAATCLGGAIRDPLAGRAYVISGDEGYRKREPAGTGVRHLARQAAHQKDYNHSRRRLLLVRQSGGGRDWACRRTL